MRNVIHETELGEYATCPLRLDGVPKRRLQSVLEASQNAMKMILLKEFEQHKAQTPSATSLRELIDVRIPKGQQRLVLPAARRLAQFFERHSVVHPVSPYALNFNKATVKGEYGLVYEDPVRQKRPLIVRLRIGTVNTGLPDLMNMARWLHFEIFETDMPSARVLNYALDKELAWFETYDLDTARDALAALGQVVVEKRRFPSVGAHCKDCPSRTCLGLLKGAA